MIIFCVYFPNLFIATHSEACVLPVMLQKNSNCHKLKGRHCTFICHVTVYVLGLNDNSFHLFI